MRRKPGGGSHAFSSRAWIICLHRLCHLFLRKEVCALARGRGGPAWSTVAAALDRKVEELALVALGKGREQTVDLGLERLVDGSALEHQPAHDLLPACLGCRRVSAS